MDVLVAPLTDGEHSPAAGILGHIVCKAKRMQSVRKVIEDHVVCAYRVTYIVEEDGLEMLGF